jgi:3-dehydroquinate synthase
VEKIHIQFKLQSTNIYIGNNLLRQSGSLLVENGLQSRAFIITSPTVADIYLDIVRSSCDRAGISTDWMIIPDGEENKNLQWVSRIYDEMFARKIDKATTIIAMGGGMIGDLAGFAASTFLRGIEYVIIPTTIMSQVDSSIGGKVAVNHSRGKNLIGSFYHPRLVVTDISTLETLSKRELIGGLSEVVKYGIIADRELFELLENNVALLLSCDKEFFQEVITRACKIKAGIVEIDERENGPLAYLHYGHTIGLAIEKLTNYVSYRHGEAVSIGIAMASRISRYLNHCSEEAAARQLNLLKGISLPVEPPLLNKDDLISQIRFDKKVSNGKITFVLCDRIGSAFIKTDVSEQVIREIL